MNTIKNKMLGCLYGQAIGDALGLGSEFMSKDEVLKSYPGGLKNYDQIIQVHHIMLKICIIKPFIIRK